MKKWLVLLLLAGALLWWRHEPMADWRGLPAARGPVQRTTAVPAPFSSGDYTITPLAHYSARAVVLARKRYRYDRGAKLSPVDLALAWGPMSAASAINELKISQSGRWYQYRWGADGPPLDPAVIARHSANTHFVPADPNVRRRLLGVRRHELVEFSGYLVEITGPDGYRWRSSLSRDDTGGGACEVVWLVSLDTATP